MPLKQLRVRLLGGLEVEGIDAKALGSRKARTLVKVLALGRGASVSSDRVVEALWPGDDVPAKPLEQVGVLVSRLRSVVGAERLSRTDAGWALAVDWLDIAELEERVDEAAARLAAGNAGAARAAARAALALVRGELLADEPDPVWAEAARAAVARSVARARLIGAEAALAAGDASDAAAAAQGALDHDPYDEAALRVLMRSHAAAGRPASALAVYARVRALLAEDLGVDPTQETEELHTSILLAEPVPAEPEVRAVVPTLVGRADALAALDRAAARAMAGEAVLVSIEGEAGIGKTTVLNAWCASQSSAVVLHGRCDELGRDLPLQPILDGLDVHLRRLGASEAEAVLGDAEPLLGPLLGRFSSAATGGAATTVPDATAGQALLFASLLAVVERAAGGRLAIVAVEDVHLAGGSTLDWLRFAARRGQRLVVVATRRPEGAVPGAGEVISLGPLDLESVAALVGDDRAEDLLRRSGGHPLFLTELAAADDALPASIREAVAGRVDGLGDASATLRTAAVLGEVLDVDLLAGVLELPVSTLLAHIDAGMHAGVIEERNAQLRYRHELVREALVADTTATRRAFAHREAARVLEGRPGRDPLDVAYHARAGGDVSLAARALLDGAATAVSRFDTQVALSLLDDAIALDDARPARVARARVRMVHWDVEGAKADVRAALDAGGDAATVELAAWVEYYARDYDRAFRFAEQAIERAEDDGLRASCLAMTGRVLHARGDIGGAHERLTKSVAIAPTSVRGYARAWLASLRMHQGLLDEAVELADRAEADGRWLGHPFVRHHGHFARVLALGQQGRIADAVAALDRGQEVGIAAGEEGVRFVIGLENVRSWLLRRCGGLEEANEISAAALEAAEGRRSGQTGEMHGAALLDLFDGALALGDLDLASHAEQRAELVTQVAVTMAWHHRQRLGVLQAQLALLKGDLDRARERAAWVITDTSERGTRRYRALGEAVHALVELRAGERLDLDDVEAKMSALDGCAAPEAWSLTAELAAASGVDRWWRDAERRAGALIGGAGELAEPLRRYVATRFSELGR